MAQSLFFVDIDEALMVGYASFSSQFETKFTSAWSAPRGKEHVSTNTIHRGERFRKVPYAACWQHMICPVL